jgi:hypothetical protein
MARVKYLKEPMIYLRPDVLEQEHTNQTGGGPKKCKRGVIFQFCQDSFEFLVHFYLLLKMQHPHNGSKSADVDCINLPDMQLSCKYIFRFLYYFRTANQSP